MSAFYAIAYADCIQVLTDGAIYADDGTIVALEEKVFRSDTLPFAVTGRGSHGSVKAMAGLILMMAKWHGVDGALGRLQDMLAERHTRTDAVAVDFLVACISEAYGPKLYYFTTHSGFADVEPFTLYDVGHEHCGGPIPDPNVLHSLGFPERMQRETLIEAGADLFEAMRMSKMEHVAHPDKPMLYGVGGHVDMTIVSAFGVETTRLRTWDDEVGRKIEPWPTLSRVEAA